MPLTSRRGRLAAAAVLLAAAGATLAAAPPAQAQPAPAQPAPCTPYLLPGLPGGDGNGNVMWINDAGQYVGTANDASDVPHAVWWTHAGPDLATGWTIHQVPVGPGSSELLDVNQNGLMVGVFDDTGQAFVYDSGTGATSWLAKLPGGHWTYGRRINASGVVAGTADAQDGLDHATVWRPPYTVATKLANAGGSQSIGTKDGAKVKNGTQATGINDAGTAIGTTLLGSHVEDTASYARNGEWRGGLAPPYIPVLWHADGQVERLDAGVSQAQGFAINDAGTAVGDAYFDASPNAWLAPAYWQDGQLHSMGAADNVLYGIARGITQGGWSSGMLVLDDFTVRAFVWTGAGDLQPLPLLAGLTDSASHAVSDTFEQVGGDMGNESVDRAAVWQCPSGFTTG